MLLAVLILLASCARHTELRCDVDPAIFCQPFEKLNAVLPSSAKQQLLALPQNQYAALHMGLGLDVRNRFGLWEDNDITRYFRAHGVNHPDYMSTPFIAGFVEYLQGKHVDMAREIKLWVPGPPPPPPPEPSGYTPHAVGLTTHSSGRRSIACASSKLCGAGAAKFKR